ncbi:class I SAM-dependent methyltransferase [Paraburkholderia kururiensis]|jgi:2-polyprenyl-3-methyl-5-hydroxy-6-metoxy-1,4-benzoquinol methylase|uniref:class I SAM-dependent methyltransferase n=1 Tax=Paraburkholderia kururiensis TaxID=984307 RepID=UPI0018F657BC|nr:class I SAM-dependent methyltransferase [Paraburkholderia kururiensis]
MNIFDPNELAGIDSLLANVESGARGNMDMIHQMSHISVKASGDLSYFQKADPYSDEYIERIKVVHEEIIGKKHQSEFEGLPRLNPEYEKQWAYPWGTRDAATVARALIAYGFLIKIADLSPNARILEVGCGMGSLTWNLAKMGYRVDALDPNKGQCDCVVEMTKDLTVPPQIIVATLNQWLETRPRDYKYDAVIFFESFHHVMDHQSCLLRLTHDGHIEDDAKIFLAAEPIFDRVCDLLPYPWGPRLDGESLRAMRRWGWLELGFTRDYITNLLKRVGMAADHFETEAAMPLSQIIVGSRKNLRPYFEVALTETSPRYDATLQDGFDLSRDGFPSFLKWATGLSITEATGRWSVGDRIELIFHDKLPRSFELELSLNDVFGPNVGKDLVVDVGTTQKIVRLAPVEDCSSYTFAFDNVDSKALRIDIPHPLRPKDMPELNIEDARRIGIAVRSIRVKTCS